MFPILKNSVHLLSELKDEYSLEIIGFIDNNIKSDVFTGD